MTFKDKVVVVTGGGGGIGAAICREFANVGAKVAITDVREKEAQSVAEEILKNGGLAEAYAMDVTKKADVDETSMKIAQDLGTADIWVNCAGISKILPFLDHTEELWDLTLNINLKGTFLCCQAAIRQMLPKKRGVIINMSSQSGQVGTSHFQAYCASKFGVIGLTQSLAVEFAREGIRVNAICPGVVWTPMWDSQVADYAKKRNMKPEEVKPYFESKIPMGRLALEKDVARMALFLASEDAGYLTGQSLNVSGGTIM